MDLIDSQRRLFFRPRKRAQKKLIGLPESWRRRLTFEMLEGRALLTAFTAGDLAVVQVGATGTTTALGDTGTAVFIDEYSPSGTLVQQIALPTTATPGGNQALVLGDSTNEGELNLSTDGQDLLLTGYDTTVGSG